MSVRLSASGSPSDPSKWRESGLETAAADITDVWYAPLPGYRVLGPFAQEVLGTSARAQRDPTSDLVAPLVPFTRTHQGAHSDRFKVTGRWRGWVTALLTETFVSEVEDLMWNSAPHQVELPVALVSDFDRELLVEDSIFYWTVGYRRRKGGTRVQESRVRFRRAPHKEPWAERRGKEWAAQVRRALDEAADS